jgi:hypothetical protein
VNLFAWLLVIAAVLLAGGIALLAITEFIDDRRRQHIDVERRAADLHLQRLTHAVMVQMVDEARQSLQRQGERRE